jgi:chemotaxis protein methyltransferase CheR
MIAPLQFHEFEKLRDLIINACGIYLTDDKDYLVESRLTDLGNELGAKNFGDLHQIIIRDMNKLMPRVVDLMTTNETYWFRDDSLWNAMENHIIPGFFHRLMKGEKREIRIWSAASSTGQEPYSLSILIDELAERLGKFAFKDSFRIIATDISDEALMLARSGKSNVFSVKRGLSDKRREKYFTKEGHHYVLNPDIMKRVEFKKFNLMDSFILLGRFDLVLCRNVAIYFTDDFKKELFRKISRTLNPEGLLIIGASESLLGHSNIFESRSHGNALFYQLKG